MKRVGFSLTGLLAICAFLSAQDVIINPDKPLNPKAGRVLELREEMRITDEGGEFFLRRPRIVKAAPDGSLFILERENLYHLDRDGRYLGDFFKKGQGPGEVNYVSNFDFDRDRLIVQSSYPEKAVWFDLSGRLAKDVSLGRIGRRVEFAFYSDGTYWLFQYAVPAFSAKPEEADMPQILTAVSEDGRDVREFASFANRIFHAGGGIVSQDLLFAPLGKRYLCISHTRNYEIDEFDCREGKIIRTFGRKYARVKRPKGYAEPAIILNGTSYEAPGVEYLPDIGGLFVFKDRLWAMTSTKDDKRGVLVDVYDLEGKYVDAVYLNVSGTLVNTHGDSILVREKRADGLMQIVMYKVVS